MGMQIHQVQVPIDTYQKVGDACGDQPYPLNIAPTIAAVDAGLAQIARIDAAWQQAAEGR